VHVANASRALRRAALVLACASAFAGCSTGDAAPKTIEVRMHFSKYLPDSLEVAAGTTVEFVVVNEDPIAHEFIIGTEAEQLEHEKGSIDDDHTGPGEASVPAESTVRLSFTFAKAGPLFYACHLPGHYRYGMKGSLKVI
jgi:uncharacterized cupredoxin-like copper-binding protein